MGGLAFFVCGFSSVVFPLWFFLCGFSSVVFPLWFFLCGFSSVVFVCDFCVVFHEKETA